MRTRKFDPAAMAEAFLNAAKMLQGMANEQPTQNIAKVKKSKKAAKDKKPAKKGGFVAFLKDRNEQRNAEQNPKQRKAAMDCARKHPTIDDEPHWGGAWETVRHPYRFTRLDTRSTGCHPPPRIGRCWGLWKPCGIDRAAGLRGVQTGLGALEHPARPGAS